MGPDTPPRFLSEPLRTWSDLGLHHLLGTDPAPAPEPAVRPRIVRQGAEDCSPKHEPETISPPEPWKSILGTAPKPCHTVWTYFDLGSDMGGRPDPSRRDLCSAIISNLKWPKGTILFIPFTIVSPDGIAPRIDVFWKCVNSISPNYLVVFGRRALFSLLPKAPLRYGFFPHEGRKVLFLPGMSDMLPDNREKKRITWEYLKQIPL